MKKLLLVAVGGMFVLASCKKDYTCECKITGSTTTASVAIKNVTKADAKVTCDKNDLAGYADCSIK